MIEYSRPVSMICTDDSGFVDKDEFELFYKASFYGIRY